MWRNLLSLLKPLPRKAGRRNPGDRSAFNGGAVAGGILILMNRNGNPGSLVASHPGNTNAVKHGVHSLRLIEPRAAEIVAQLTQSFDFSVAQRVAVEQVARCSAILEALDRDLDEHGLIDKRGEPRYLLNHRSRISRQLDLWLSKIAPSIERQTADAKTASNPGRSDYIAELQRIALGQDTTASARDRVSALKELVEIDSAPGPVSVIHMHVPDDILARIQKRRRPPELPDDGDATDAARAHEIEDRESS
jgi:hypothetical protein